MLKMGGDPSIVGDHGNCLDVATEPEIIAAIKGDSETTVPFPLVVCVCLLFSEHSPALESKDPMKKRMNLMKLGQVFRSLDQKLKVQRRTVALSLSRFSSLLQENGFQESTDAFVSVDVTVGKASWNERYRSHRTNRPLITERSPDLLCR
jgi:hypothetical protein